MSNASPIINNNNNNNNNAGGTGLPPTSSSALAQNSTAQLKQRGVRQFPLADGRFVIVHRIGSGAFGDLYQGIDTRNNSKVAVKLESRKVTYPQLSYESKVYRVLHSGSGKVIGIPRVHYYDTEGDYNMLVMDLCGPSLEDLFNYCGRRLSLKTVCMLAHQMLQRIEFIHEKGFIHRDIKPENFVFGIEKKGHILHLIDFGLSKLYWDKRKQTHIPFCEGKPLTGTARYCSAWTHRGYEQSRRDDLEAVSFIIVYFLLGSLPWQGITVKDPQIKTMRIGEKKISTSLEELCRGLPVEILQYCTYCRELKFTDKPDYDYLRDLFFTVAKKHEVLHPSQAPVISPAASATSAPTTVIIVPSLDDETDEDYNNSGDAAWGNNSSSTPHESGKPRYDWMFDWFVKRLEEIRGGRRKQQQMQALSQQEIIGENVSMGARVASSASDGASITNPDSIRVSSSRVVHV